MNIEIEAPELAGYQEQILYNPARFTITEASTKAGKTFSHIWWIFERAHAGWNQPGYEHWWVAPVYSQAKIAFIRVKRIVEDIDAYRVNETELTITTPLGTVMRFKSAKNPDNLFGEDVYSSVFDEAPRAKVEAFYALRSTLTATNAPMKLIGNFGGTANWMHQLKEKAKTDPAYAYFKVTAWDAVEAGILDREEIEQAQKDLPPKIFKQLYLAEEQESDDMLCSYDAIRDLWTNAHARRGTRYITADVALHGSDKFRIIVWDGWRIIDLITIDKCEADEATDYIKAAALKHRVGRSNITYDADGLGSFLRGYLRNAKPFYNGGTPIKTRKKLQVNYKNLKSQCGYEFAKRVNAREVAIDCEVDKADVTKELECLQSYELDKDGKMQVMPKVKIKEIIGHSPDILDALIMRMVFDLAPKPKQVRARVC